MKLVLPSAAFAGPADQFVGVASRFRSSIELWAGARQANAKDLAEVQALSSLTCDGLLVAAAGEDAQAALVALSKLAESNSCGSGARTRPTTSSGIAVGRAVVARKSDHTGAGMCACLPSGATERRRVQSAFDQVRRDLDAILRSLPPEDAALFEPEIEILRALEPSVLSRVAVGDALADAIWEETTMSGGKRVLTTSDLVLDARERVLEAYANAGGPRFAQLLRNAHDGEVILVAEALTPSMVAMAPERVTGIVAVASDVSVILPGVGYASHAAILARGRGIPLMFVPPHIGLTVTNGDPIVLDTRTPPPRLWLSPSEAVLSQAQNAQDELRRKVGEGRSREIAELAHLPTAARKPFAVGVNVGSLFDYVPRGADGIGLVRTELLFSARGLAPTFEDQLSTLLLLTGKARRGSIVVRLFDAGGDKPLAWLDTAGRPPETRGIALLRCHPNVLAVQVAAIARAAEHADVHLLIPLVRNADDVHAIRRLAPPALPIGAMIETPGAVACALEIAQAADFVCIGTNDLSAMVLGEDRATAVQQPTPPSVFNMIGVVLDAAHRCERPVGVCGEMAGDPAQASVLVGLGVDSISVAPSRLAEVKGALASTHLESCVNAARMAVGADGWFA